MEGYTLNIAGYRLHFKRGEGSPDLLPASRFMNFFYTGSEKDITIKVRSGSTLLPAGTSKVFSAPYAEEQTDGTIAVKSEDFWSVHRNGDDMFLCTTFAPSAGKKGVYLRFSYNSPEWEMVFDPSVKEADPMEYPLDGLILYYLTVIHGDIFIHASAVSLNGKGYLFSGVSGKGKSTMSLLWQEKGARVIHDDRLIIRRSATGFVMYNTPVYQNEEPREESLNSVFLISHGTCDHVTEIRGAAAVSRLMANCIQHNWEHNLTSRLLNSVNSLCSEVPLYELRFLPHKEVVDYILSIGGGMKEVLRDIGFTLLSEGKKLRIRADGYSMCPTMMPGTIVHIEPLTNNSAITPGEVIVWKRRSGMVVHRLVRIENETGSVKYFTRGDSCVAEDLPVGQSDILGRVVAVERKNGTISTRKMLTNQNQSYIYNRLFTWIYIRYKVILKKLR